MKKAGIPNPEKENVATKGSEIKLLGRIVSGGGEEGVEETKPAYKRKVQARQKTVRFVTDPRDDRNFNKLIETSRTGLKYPEFKLAMDEIELTNNVWANIINVNPRTFSRIKTDQKTLNTPQTEKVIQLVILYEKGIDVFGDKEKFIKWLNRERIPLGGIKPIEILDTIQGMKVLENELGRIEHGIFA